MPSVLLRYAELLVFLVCPLGTQGFAPSLAHLAARPTSSTPITPLTHERGPVPRSSMPVLHVAGRESPQASAAASPSSPAEYFMVLFGGNKRKPARKDDGEAKEAELLSAIEAVQGRGRDVTPEQRELVDKVVAALEEAGGVPDRASSPLVDGKWRLIFTTTPGTASPVQRSFVGVDGFAIYQDIDIFSEAPPTVTNVVDFGDRVGKLRVTALASTPSRPMEGFVPRRGDGRFFGLNILGVSQTTPPEDPSGRIDFQFDEAGFDFNPLPFNIPYPVPFRLFGDEVKGWIDVTYLSERLRIARGNKGTLFVLQRPPPPAEAAATAASSP